MGSSVVTGAGVGCSVGDAVPGDAAALVGAGVGAEVTGAGDGWSVGEDVTGAAVGEGVGAAVG